MPIPTYSHILLVTINERGLPGYCLALPWIHSICAKSGQNREGDPRVSLGLPTKPKLILPCPKELPKGGYPKRGTSRDKITLVPGMGGGFFQYLLSLQILVSKWPTSSEP